MRGTLVRSLLAIPVAVLSLAPRALPAQAHPPALPADLAAERAAFAEWLATAPVSPAAAVSAAALGADGVTLDANGHGVRVLERAGVPWVEGDGPARPLARNRPVRVGRVTVLVTGEPPRSRIMMFQPGRAAPAPAYYSYDPALVFAGSLVPPAVPGSERVLTPDGVEVEASEAGTVSFDLGGRRVLKVLRLPDPASGESSLEVYVRDSTSGAGSYPAGRFVTLTPLGGGRYRLDFNRARNPFCAYNAAYPCPAPWRGNTVPAAIRAGERYESHP
jgi:uncharacterized protein (DUF1684 family)